MIVVVGKNSFLASQLSSSPQTNGWLFLSHDEALKNTDWIQDASVVINFALDDHMKDQPYDIQKDIDAKLATLIAQQDVHYMMMSSRTVYGDAPEDLCLEEGRMPAPLNEYGKNKWETEKQLSALLDPSKLTVLRLSNVFGYEPDRPTFFGLIFSKISNNQPIEFDIAEDSQRDFLSARQWVEYMLQIVTAIKPGIYNLGSGFGASPQEISEWVSAAGDHPPAIFTGESYKGQFILDMAKTHEAFNIKPYDKAQLQKDVMALFSN